MKTFPKHKGGFGYPFALNSLFQVHSFDLML